MARKGKGGDWGRGGLPIGHASTVDDVRLDHILHRFLSFFSINPRRRRPLVCINQPIFHFARRHPRRQKSEFLCEWLVVEEDPGIMKLMIESVFNLSHRPQRIIQFPISTPRKYRQRNSTPQRPSQC
jgi:hypothetical protein